MRRIFDAFGNARKAEILDEFGKHLPFVMWARRMNCRRENRTYLWVSGGYEAAFGFKGAEMIGKTPYEVFEPKTAKIYDNSDLLVYEGRELSRPIWAQVKGGENRLLMTKKFPLTVYGERYGVLGYSIPFNDAESMFSEDDEIGFG